MENTGQILDQIPEVHPLVGGKVEENFAAVKGALGADQLHIQPVFLDLLGTDAFRPGLLGAVFRHDLFVLGGGKPQHLPQGGHHILFGDPVDAGGAHPVFGAPGGVNNHMVALDAGDVRGVKEVDLLPGAELNIHNGYQGIVRFFHDLLLISSQCPGQKSAYGGRGHVAQGVFPGFFYGFIHGVQVPAVPAGSQ